MLVYQRKGNTLVKLNLGDGGVSGEDLASLEKAVMAAMREEVNASCLRLDGTSPAFTERNMQFAAPPSSDTSVRQDVIFNISPADDYDANDHGMILAQNLYYDSEEADPTGIWERRSLFLNLRSRKDGKIGGGIGVAQDNKGRFFCRSTPPREGMYWDDVDTLRASTNRHLLKGNVIQIHVGGANASDTADLFQGRGLSEDCPFASIQAAASWARLNLACDTAEFILHADMNFPTLDVFWQSGAIRQALIRSDSTLRTLHARQVICYAGWLELKDIGINLNNTSRGIVANGALSMLVINGSVNVSGSTAIIADANNGGFIKISGSMSGSVTGCRYSCTTGGRILTGGQGPNAIPGTTAGTCDASGVYI